MVWNDNYGRDYSGTWYGRGMGRHDYEPGHFNRSSGWNSGYAGSPYRGYGGGYDHAYRRPPERSPAYGQGGDREVRQWARHHGYDEGFQVSPNQYSRGGSRNFSPGYERNWAGGWQHRDRWESQRDPRSRNRDYWW
jgi:hypothetical protein